MCAYTSSGRTPFLIKGIEDYGDHDRNDREGFFAWLADMVDGDDDEDDAWGNDDDDSWSDDDDDDDDAKIMRKCEKECSRKCKSRGMQPWKTIYGRAGCYDERQLTELDGILEMMGSLGIDMLDDDHPGDYC